jgi:hypothetical protein
VASALWSKSRHLSTMPITTEEPDQFSINCRYFSHDDALSSLRYISGTKLDERIIRADIDPGYLENRQYGRGELSFSCPLLVPSLRVNSYP